MSLCLGKNSLVATKNNEISCKHPRILWPIGHPIWPQWYLYGNFLDQKKLITIVTYCLLWRNWLFVWLKTICKLLQTNAASQWPTNCTVCRQHFQEFLWSALLVNCLEYSVFGQSSLHLNMATISFLDIVLI